MNKLYVIRHGQTDWNVKHLIQGQTDIELNDEGIKQAIDLRKEIDLSNIDVCLCSPLKRTVKTASIIVDDKILVEPIDLLIERNFGEYEGSIVTYELIEELFNLNKEICTKGEKWIDCLNRANDLIKFINDNYDNKNIMIVSHGAFIKAIHFSINGYDKDTDFLSFFAKNATIYEYEV